VNLGGEPERDDSGLPPVDIEIPDDARELDRDVQAYRREMRARRRRERRMRLHAPLTRDGVVLPLLASCLVLALIAGTLLTVFTAGPNGEGDLPRQPRSPSAAASQPVSSSRSGSPAASSGANSPVAGPSDSPTAATSKYQLPRESIMPKSGKPMALTSLLDSYGSLVIALVPVTCNCTATVRQLVNQVHKAGLQPYLVSAMGQLSKIQKLAPQVPKAVIAADASGVLYRDYHPHSGLTALLVHPDGKVGTVTLSGTKFSLANQLSRLSAEANSARASSPATTTSPR
jgi:hypothetical protein